MDASGNLACPDEGRGRDVVTLNMGNIEAYANRRQPGEGWGPADGTVAEKQTNVAPPVTPNSPGQASTGQNVGPAGALSVAVDGWYRADNVVSDSTGVTTWTDLGPFSNSLSPLSTTTPPTIVTTGPRGLPAVQFLSTASGVRRAVSLSNQMWCWIILRLDVWSNGGFIVTNSAGWSLTMATSSPNLRMNGRTNGTLNGAAGGGWVRVIANFDPATGATLQVVDTIVADSPLPQAGSTPSTLIVGSLASISLAELLITRGPPTTTEIAQIEAYGAARYGSELF